MKLSHLPIYFFFLFLLASFTRTPPHAVLPKSMQVSGRWADSVLSTLSTEQKIAQLIMVAAYSNKDQKHINEIDSLVEKYSIGGLIFFQGGPMRQATLTNRYQAKSKVPLAIAIDGEWGLAMRLDSTLIYPWQMTLGAIQNDSLIFRMGEHIAEQCKRMGMHINFAPVVDVNVNPSNPIIYARSFGENKYKVAEKGIAYMKGMQKHRVLANAKHFPGHGDTDSDSHKTLPILKHNRSRLDSIEIYPFTRLFNEGIGSVMVAHLYIPSFEKTENTATTLSYNLVTKTLKDSLGFKGLVFTDALNMKGVSKFYKPGEVDLKAFLAGNDVLLYSENVPLAIAKIKAAIDSGLLSMEELNARCRKVLCAKEWMNLHTYKPIDLNKLHEDLHKPVYRSLIKELFENALTTIKNESNLLPLSEFNKKIAIVSIGSLTPSVFQETASLYANIRQIHVPVLTDSTYAYIKSTIGETDVLVVSMHKPESNPIKKYNLSQQEKDLLEKICQLHSNTALFWFANPYTASNLKVIKHCRSFVMAYQNNNEVQHSAAQLLFGAIGSSGKLPIGISSAYKEGHGIDIQATGVLRYNFPESQQMNSIILAKIDSIAREGIREGAYPGCQVLVARNGTVVYHKAFGKHTYEESSKAVQLNDLYDIASVTKIAATVPAIMMLQDKKQLNLNQQLGEHLGNNLQSEEYKQINLREMLAHQAGLPAWVPFYTRTLIKNQPDPKFFSKDSSEVFPHRVADSLFLVSYYPDTMIKRLSRIPLKKKEYRYSDIGYYFLKEIIEQKSGKGLDAFTQEFLYCPLGMHRTGYKPRNNYILTDIVPSEKDNYFRHQLIHGYVHDPGAAMLGGVGGHAGLFSNANDLAKLMQLFLQHGKYAGKKYIDSTTVAEYTACQFCLDETGQKNESQRRGAGFDKPVRDGSSGPTCNCVSYLSFGHTGFTGTMAWADPEKGIVYIFLSNRVHPDGENKKLLNMNIRTRIQEVIYLSVK